MALKESKSSNKEWNKKSKPSKLTKKKKKELWDSIYSKCERGS